MAGLFLFLNCIPAADVYRTCASPKKSTRHEQIIQCLESELLNDKEIPKERNKVLNKQDFGSANHCVVDVVGRD